MRYPTMDEQVRDGDPFACVERAADEAAREDRIAWWSEFRPLRPFSGYPRERTTRKVKS